MNSQPEADEGLHIAHLLLKLYHSSCLVNRKDWEYLDNFHIAALQKEGGMSHQEALHVANQIDRFQSSVTAMGRFEFFADAFMMWLIGGSFFFAGLLLALINTPEALGGKLMIPVSIVVGIVFIIMPFFNRKRGFFHNRECFYEALICILGTGLVKRSRTITERMIRDLKGKSSKEVLVQVIQKYLDSHGGKLTSDEEKKVVTGLLNDFKVKTTELPSHVLQSL